MEHCNSASLAQYGNQGLDLLLPIQQICKVHSVKVLRRAYLIFQIDLSVSLPVSGMAVN